MKKRSVQWSHDRCKGEGRGWEGEVANGHMTVGGKGRAGEARHSGPARPVRPAIMGPSGSFDPSSRPVRSAQHKAHGLAAGLKKKNKFRPGPVR